MEPRMVEEQEWGGEQHKAFNEAYASLQLALPKLGKNTRGHGYQYAALPDVLAAIRGVLHQHGFTVRFRTWSPDSASVGVRVILTHVPSGVYECSELIAQPEKCVGGRMNGIQARGSFITYATRYCLLSVLGTTADVDLDGAAAGDAPAPAVSEASPEVGGTREDYAAAMAYSQAQEYVHGGVGADGIPF